MDPHFPPVHMYLGEALSSLGRYQEAEKELLNAGGLSGRTHIGYVGFVLCREQHFDEARKVLRDIQERSRRQYISPYHQALVHIGLGEKDKAIDLLEQAVDQHYPWAIHYSVEPVLDSLRNEPRFKLLLRRIGLPDLSEKERLQ